jgi:SAM-dependent methyltransferase
MADRVQMKVSPAEHARLKELVAAFLGDAKRELELEAVAVMPVTQNMFSNVITALRASHPLAVTYQLDVSTAQRRFEFEGEQQIRDFLRRGAGEGPPATRVITKKSAMAPLKLEEYPIKVNLKSETPIDDGVTTVPSSRHHRYRFKQRFSYAVEETGCRVDCTVVQQADNVPVSELLRSARRFEIEVEMVDRSMQTGDAVLAFLRTVYMTLVHVYGCTAVCTQTEKREMVRAYEAVMGRAGDGIVGPQPVTLELKNLEDPKPGTVSIWAGYTVTDKADGDRAQLFVAGGTAYLVDNRQNVSIAAVGCADALNGTVLDGELISVTKAGLPTRSYAVFDAYAYGDRAVTDRPLMTDGRDDRLGYAARAVAALGAATLMDTLTVKVKKFALVDRRAGTVADMLAATKDGEYHVDGLIFTPAEAPVGGRYKADDVKLKGRWTAAMKWKPPSHNSVDFLVRFKRYSNREGMDVITTKAVPGSPTPAQYKTLLLHAGYSPSKWEPVDPVAYLVKGTSSRPSPTAYVAKLFDPDNTGASATLVRVDDEGRALTEAGEAIEDNTIVECNYDITDRVWTPMRVRTDKTERLLSNRAHGLQGTANDWSTALGVWRSIRYPVTTEMLTGTQPVSVDLAAVGDAYFVKDFDRKDAYLKQMNKFHNFGIKAPLLAKFAVKDGRLFEFACGKGGDLGRWLAAGYKTVVGSDVSLDNLVNPEDGIYARMIAMNVKAPMVFFQMDAATRMQPPLDEVNDAILTSSHPELLSVLWNVDKSANAELDRFRGLIAKGFDTVSCQFAVHYLFKSDDTLDRFVNNVAYTTRVGGHFIGTTFDGDTVSAALRRHAGKVTGQIGDLVVWNLERKYEEPATEGTGQVVEVYVETIGQVLREYLVSFKTLTQRLKSAGFELVETEMFGDAARRLADDADMKDMISAMDPVVRRFSEFSRWFAFKKVR